jgi:hypothetical protein
MAWGDFLKDLEQAGIGTTTKPASSPVATNPAAEEPSTLSKIWDTVSNPAFLKTVAPIAGGLIANAASKSDYANAEQTQRDAVNLAGTYKELGPSATSLIQDNPEMVALRRQAIQKLLQQAETGTTPEDEALARQNQKTVEQNFSARQNQMQDERNRRGVQAGSGLALAQALGGNQVAQQQQSESADMAAIRKQQAKSAAIANLGNSASNALQQDFGRDLDRASAADKFNMTNITNQINAGQNKAKPTQAVAETQANQGARTADTINTIAGALPKVFDLFKSTPQNQKK